MHVLWLTTCLSACMMLAANLLGVYYLGVYYLRSLKDCQSRFLEIGRANTYHVPYSLPLSRAAGRDGATGGTSRPKATARLQQL